MPDATDHDDSMLSQRRRALVRRLCHRKTREREGLFLAEGTRCARTVIDAGAEIRFAVAASDFGTSDDETGLLHRLEAHAVEVIRVPPAELRELADTRTPQGILLVCVEPHSEPRLPPGRPLRILVLDAVQDPGNVGTLIRVAAGFGASGVVALDGTADPWGTKAVRASAGYVATLPVYRWSWEQAATEIADAGLPILVASGEGHDITRSPSADSWALVVGNEGAGVRDEIRAAAAERVAVPLMGHVDSLNVAVAGSILLFSLTRPAPDRPTSTDATWSKEPDR